MDSRLCDSTEREGRGYVRNLYIGVEFLDSNH